MRSLIKSLLTKFVRFSNKRNIKTIKLSKPRINQVKIKEATKYKAHPFLYKGGSFTYPRTQ